MQYFKKIYMNFQIKCKNKSNTFHKLTLKRRIYLHYTCVLRVRGIQEVLPLRSIFVHAVHGFCAPVSGQKSSPRYCSKAVTAWIDSVQNRFQCMRWSGRLVSRHYGRSTLHCSSLKATSKKVYSRGVIKPVMSNTAEFLRLFIDEW